MQKMNLLAIAVVAILLLSEAPAWAQFGAGGMGMGQSARPLPSQRPLSMGGGMGARPKKRSRKSQAPVLSPALNMLPEVTTSFEGQFLMRQLPQEQFLRSTSQNAAGVAGLQNAYAGQQTQLNNQQNQIRTGVGKTGHTARYMNYGSYYSLGKAGGGGG